MADSRVDDSHQIREKTPSGEYYPARFREDVAKLVLELRKLLLANHDSFTVAKLRPGAEGEQLEAAVVANRIRS